MTAAVQTIFKMAIVSTKFNLWDFERKKWKERKRKRERERKEEEKRREEKRASKMGENICKEYIR